jgi:hypothetical protein
MLKRHWSIAVAVLVVTCTALVVPAVAQTAQPAVVNADGVGAPPKGAGMGTKAALENPKCNADAIEGWGVFPLVTSASGPFCVAPAPADNGGGTSRGVTATTIKVAVVVPNDQQLAKLGAGGSRAPVNVATGGTGRFQDVVTDAWPAFAHVYETWGRTVEFSFITSGGDDEAAQRADAVAIEQLKPFAVIDTYTMGLSTLASALAAKKILVFDYGTTTQDALDQAPYRWAQNDPSGSAINAGEFMGKQLVKGKAKWAGDDSLKSEQRKFGVVYPKGFDIDAFTETFAKYGGKLATPPLEFVTNGSSFGDQTLAQAAAPGLVAKLKTAGVTSVIMFTDLATGGAMTKVATQQEYSPEWLLTAYQYQDVALLARDAYDQEQFAHAFGLSVLYPLTTAAAPAPLSAWYWGPGRSTTEVVTTQMLGWLAAGVQYAGPTLTPSNFQKGLFAVPARGGAASDSPITIQNGYGKTNGLTYPSYFLGGVDFAPIWWDSETTGSSNAIDVKGKGVVWYVNDAKRYIASTWPKQTFTFFDKTGAVFVFDTPPPSQSGTPVPCTGCPSSGGPGTSSTG